MNGVESRCWAEEFDPAFARHIERLLLWTGNFGLVRTKTGERRAESWH